MGLSQTEVQEITNDPVKVKDFIERYQASSSPTKDDITDLQLVLTALGLYAAHPHKYYADGVDGPFTQHGLRMAQELFGVEDPQNSDYTGNIISETQRLINDGNLTPNEVLRLQTNLHYLEHVDAMDGDFGAREDFELDPGKPDGYLGPKTARASAEFARKYGIEMHPHSAIGREARRENIDLTGITLSDADTPAPGLGDTFRSVSGTVRPLQELLSSSVMTASKIADLQESLTAAGLNPGGVDGQSGRKTINGTDGNGGVIAALKSNPELLTSMSEDALAMVWKHASSSNRTWLRNTWDDTFPEGNARADWINELTAPGNTVSTGAMTILRPDLLARLDQSRTLPNGSTVPVRYFVEKIYDAVEEYNSNLGRGEVALDANLVVNQMWQESKFDPDIVGPSTKYGRAEGLAQFLPSTGRRWGLETQADRFNPDKAIPAAIAKIGHDTQTYGDQRLAMVAYNGGGGAVDWVKDHRGANIGIDEWMEFVANERAVKGEGPFGAWRNQTYEYVEINHSDYWSGAEIAEANRLQQYAGLPSAPGMPGIMVASTGDDPALTNSPS